MNERMLWCVLSCAVAVAGCTGGGPETKTQAPAPSQPPAAAPGSLQSAHDAYLDGDFLGLGERVRDVLLDTRSSRLVKENALELLDKAYEVQKGSLPSRFVLPPGFEGIKYGVVRGMSGQIPFLRVFLYGHTRDASHLKGVTVRRLPDETLLDSNDATKGSLVLRHDKAGFDTFVIERVVTALPEDGVFSLRFDLDDGTAPEGWFISHSQASSASPEIRTPLASGAVSDPHPRVSWVPFRSPEYQPFEFRTLSVYVSRDGGSGLAWDFWTQSYGELDAVNVGAHPPAAQTSLVPGDYWINITCGEGRMFGPVAMTRESRTVSPFHLVP